MKEPHEIRAVADRLRTARQTSEAERYLGAKRIREYAVELASYEGSHQTVYQRHLDRIRGEIEDELREKIRAERASASFTPH
jgi:hypothetical protein